VVDDHPTTDLLKRRLERLGTPGRDGGGRAEAGMIRADLRPRLLNVMMPNMNGYEVLERLRDENCPPTCRSS
jgi:CheY-like chemotaxis protein